MGLSQHDIDMAALKPISFFPHDADTRSDVKIKRLLKRCGWSGYGRWWAICETLARNDGHFFRFDDETFEIMADELGFDTMGDFHEFVEILCDLQLLINDGSHLFSERMNSNAQYAGKRRAAGAIGGRKKRGGSND